VQTACHGEIAGVVKGDSNCFCKHLHRYREARVQVDVSHIVDSERRLSKRRSSDFAHGRRIFDFRFGGKIQILTRRSAQCENAAVFDAERTSERQRRDNNRGPLVNMGERIHQLRVWFVYESVVARNRADLAWLEPTPHVRKGVLLRDRAEARQESADVFALLLAVPSCCSHQCCFDQREHLAWNGIQPYAFGLADEAERRSPYNDVGFKGVRRRSMRASFRATHRRRDGIR
jgi:hypothetical protein